MNFTLHINLLTFNCNTNIITFFLIANETKKIILYLYYLLKLECIQYIIYVLKN